MRTTVVVVGAGQAGLAMSRCLQDRSIDHVLLERDDVASAWRFRRWRSLRLLTPNWMSRLPGFPYRGDDPDGFMTAAQIGEHLLAYRAAIGAPVVTGVDVRCVSPGPSGFSVRTDQGTWSARAVVVATGAADVPHVPALGDSLPGSVAQLSAHDYREPGQVADGAVLVVGASSSGVQVADELRRAGREVTIAAGEHLRLPRTYRGRDIHRWMDDIGLLDERWDELEDLARARRLPSPQLIGSPERRDLDLRVLAAAGVRLTGRLAGFDGQRLQFSGSLAHACASSDLKLNRLLDRIDDHATARGLDGDLPPATRPERTPVPAPATTLPVGDFRTVVWATGYRPAYPWLDRRLLDRRGALRHDGGVLPVPGLYALGLTVGRRRKSAFIDGVGPDALDLTDHLARFLAVSRAA